MAIFKKFRHPREAINYQNCRTFFAKCNQNFTKGPPCFSHNATHSVPVSWPGNDARINNMATRGFIRGWNFSYPIFVPLEITFISKWRQRTNFNEYKNSQMSWFDTSSFSSFAKTALTQAQNLQKSIDRVLDIEDDASSASNSSGKLVTIFMVLNCVHHLYFY